jgi:short-subunit dehydrogenase
MANDQSIALVTGASSGIGKTYADRLARRGYNLVLVARDVSRLEALATQLRADTGVTIEVLPADLTQPEQVKAVEDRLRAEPPVTLLVNNAGAASHEGFAADDLNPLYQLVDLNVVALTRLCGAAVQGFRAHGVEGSIINIGSVVGFAPEWLPGVYGASKAYVLALSRAIQAELQGDIYVQAVLPSGTKTEIWERSGRSVNDNMMDVGELVDAALVGFDRHEAVTIPPLLDVKYYDELEAARKTLLPHLNGPHAAQRYLK